MFDLIRKQKKRSSVINDAVKFARDDFDVDFEPLDSSFTFTYNNKGNRDSTSDIHTASKILKYECKRKMQDSLCHTTWQGIIMKERLHDEHLVIEDCFKWCSKWKDAPVELINDVQSIYLQIVPTLTFRKHRGDNEIVSTVCRLCKSDTESIRHLLSNCNKFVNTFYIHRHNRVLQYILFHVLKKYELVDKCHGSLR